MKKTLVYVAGPYSGANVFQTGGNIAAARDAAAALWDMGYAVICPHSNSANFEQMVKRATYEDFMQGSLLMVERSDVLVLLPNWEKSSGARREKDLAETLGLRIYTWPNVPKPEDL